MSCRAHLDAKDEDGNTALHLAARMVASDAVTRLLQVGADPFIKNSEGQTCIHVAAKVCDKSLIQQMLRTLDTSHEKRHQVGITR